MNIGLSIRGVQEAQKKNNAIIAALRPTNLFGTVIRGITISVHRYAVSITHVVTGTLRAAHRTAVDLKVPQGRVFIDPAAVNPQNQQRPADYGVYEQNRGGDHAFYTRTNREVGERLAKQGADMLRAKIRRPI